MNAYVGFPSIELAMKSPKTGQYKSRSYSQSRLSYFNHNLVCLSNSLQSRSCPLKPKPRRLASSATHILLVLTSIPSALAGNALTREKSIPLPRHVCTIRGRRQGSVEAATLGLIRSIPLCLNVTSSRYIRTSVQRWGLGSGATPQPESR